MLLSWSIRPRDVLKCDSKLMEKENNPITVRMCDLLEPSWNVCDSNNCELGSTANRMDGNSRRLFCSNSDGILESWTNNPWFFVMN